MTPSEQQCTIKDCQLSKIYHSFDHPNCSYSTKQNNTPLEQQAIEEFDKEFSKWEGADAWDYSELRNLEECDFYNPIKNFLLKWMRKAREDERKRIIMKI